MYDVMDTKGALLPEDVASFVAHGDVDEATVGRFRTLAGRKGIDVQPRDAGDQGLTPK